jgi:hypothetical protein
VRFVSPRDEITRSRKSQAGAYLGLFRRGGILGRCYENSWIAPPRNTVLDWVKDNRRWARLFRCRSSEFCVRCSFSQARNSSNRLRYFCVGLLIDGGDHTSTQANTQLSRAVARPESHGACLARKGNDTRGYRTVSALRDLEIGSRIVVQKPVRLRIRTKLEPCATRGQKSKCNNYSCGPRCISLPCAHARRSYHKVLLHDTPPHHAASSSKYIRMHQKRVALFDIRLLVLHRGVTSKSRIRASARQRTETVDPDKTNRWRNLASSSESRHA